MKLDPKTLSLVVPVQQDGRTVHVIAPPISKHAFQHHYRSLSRTMAQVYADGIHVFAPSVAALALRENCFTERERQEYEEGKNVEPAAFQALRNEVRRLAVVIVPGEEHPTMFDQAVARDVLTEDEEADAEGIILFFTCIWHVHQRQERETQARGMLSLWGGFLTSSTALEFRDSLRTSTATATTSPAPVPEIPQSFIPS